MDLDEIKDEIKKLLVEIDEVPDSESFDDIWEVELYESEIRSLIFDYCVEKGYDYEGFPTRYRTLIEEDDPDFEDFLTFEVMEFFVTLMAKEHEDVFELVQLYYRYYMPYDENGYTMTDVESDIVRFYNEKVSFVFDRNDWHSPEDKSRPKWPG